jgi:hypothetical protein
MRPRAHIGPLLLAVGSSAAVAGPVSAQNAIVRENQKPGTTDWLVTRVEAAAGRGSPPALVIDDPDGRPRAR